MKRIIASTILIAVGYLPASTLAQESTQYAFVADLTGMHSDPSQGAASLIRSEDEIEGRIMVNVDNAGVPITVWFIIFNNPDACTGDVFVDPVTGSETSCSFDDVFAGPGGTPGGPAGPAVINASSAISAANGSLKKNGKPAGGGVVSATYELEAGAGAGGPNRPCCFGELASGNGKGAEVHLLVDEHLIFDDWITDLFFPNPPAEGNQRGVVFLSLE